MAVAVVSMVVVSSGMACLSTALAHDDSGPLQPMIARMLKEASGEVDAAPSAGFVPERHRFLVRPMVRHYPYETDPEAVHFRPRAKVAAHAPALPVRPAPVSIYEDRSLRRGDAVMTAGGLRIFEGSDTFPYQASDFRTLTASKSIRKSLRKDLAMYDRQMPQPQEVAEAPPMTIHVSGIER